MEKRGLILSVLLILAAAMFASNLGSGVTGNTLFVGDDIGPGGTYSRPDNEPTLLAPADGGTICGCPPMVEDFDCKEYGKDWTPEYLFLFEDCKNYDGKCVGGCDYLGTCVLDYEGGSLRVAKIEEDYNGDEKRWEREVLCTECIW